MIAENRIKILDSYRLIAILGVIFFHYYARYSKDSSILLYPYGNEFYSTFYLGGYGVYFFFIISGFVISFTLKNTHSYADFWKKRFLRLFPALLLCSLITFIFFISLDTEPYIFGQSHSVENFLCSISFLPPEFLNFIGCNVDYINGSYWSLWPEIIFYLIASTIYFASPTNFCRNFFLFTVISCLMNVLLILRFGKFNFDNNLEVLNLTTLLYNFLGFVRMFQYFEISLFFLIGVLLSELFLNKRSISLGIMILVSIILLLIVYDGFTVVKLKSIHSIFLMVFAFLLFIYFPKLIEFKIPSIITRIGVVSYSLYLIHENIGVLLIHKYAFILGHFDFIFPLLIMIGMISFSLLSYKYFEKPVAVFVTKKWLKR